LSFISEIGMTLRRCAGTRLTQEDAGGNQEFRDSIFSAFTGLKHLVIRGTGIGLLVQNDVRDCISTLTRCYENISSDAMEKGELCTVPRIDVRMSCHERGAKG
jgi:hypothetical protein